MARNRREFLTGVAQGMLTASVGSALVADLGFAAEKAEDSRRLNFGPLEPLVGLLQDTPGNKLLPLLVERLRTGTDLKQILAAGALANARTFGGEDYIGFHTFMAMMPALAMSRELPEERRALPILKVLHRNSTRITETGGRANEVLHPVEPTTLPTDRVAGEVVRDAVRGKDVNDAERKFAGAARGPAAEAFNSLLFTVEDNTEVHRVVLAYRSWDMLDVLGQEQAHTMLRQSLRYCLKTEKNQNRAVYDEPRTLLPKLLDQFKLMSKPAGTRKAEDGWVDQFCMTLFRSTPAAAAEAVAAALSEGMTVDSISEAIALAANQLALRDLGRVAKWAQANKPAGSCHGDSVGVHASDTANAWANIARAADRRHQVAALILAGFQVARDRTYGGHDFLKLGPWPLAEHTEKLQGKSGPELLKEADGAIREKNQAQAAAAIHRYGQLNLPARPVFDLMLKYAISEDGALHAEKYYRTVSEEFARSRAPFHWRQLTSLARVTASSYGYPAPGYAEACRLLKV